MIDNELHDLPEFKIQSVDKPPAQDGQPQSDQGQSPDDNGQGQSPAAGQGDAQNGQSHGGDNGSTDPLRGNQADQAVNQDNRQVGQSNGSHRGATDPSSQGTSNPTASMQDSGHGHGTGNGSLGGRSSDQGAQVGPGRGDTISQGSTASQTNTAGQRSTTGETSTPGEGSTVLASPSDDKTSNNPAADRLAANPQVGSVADPGLGTSPVTNNQGGSSDQSQHSSGDASILEATQRGPASVQNGKQPSPDGTFATANDVHGLLVVMSQGAKPHSPNPADGRSQQQNLTDDPAQRPLAERLRDGDASGRAPIVDAPFLPGEKAAFVGGLPDDIARAMDYGNVWLQKHELLTDCLCLDCRSLHTEVERFFEHMEQLGGHAIERQFGLAFYSVAAVVAAVMACRVAWRQARQSVANPPLALASTLDLAGDAEAPGAIGLPHFGQFSALS